MFVFISGSNDHLELHIIFSQQRLQGMGLIVIDSYAMLHLIFFMLEIQV